MAWLLRHFRGSSPEAGQMDRKFTELQKALDEALTSCQRLKATPQKRFPTPAMRQSRQCRSNWQNRPPRACEDAVDMGNISELKSHRREALGSGSDTYGSVSDAVSTGMAEDFDFDGIEKLCDKLERQVDKVRTVEP